MKLRVSKGFYYFLFLVGFVFTPIYGDLRKPVNGQELNYIHVLFEWDQEPDAEKYQIQVSETDSFDPILFTDSTTTPLFIDTAHIEWNQSYFWRMRPDNSNNIGKSRTIVEQIYNFKGKIIGCVGLQPGYLQRIATS